MQALYGLNDLLLDNMFSERSFRYLAAKKGVKLIKSVTEDTNIRVLFHR